MGIFSVNGYPDELTEYLIERGKKLQAGHEHITKEAVKATECEERRKKVISSPKHILVIGKNFTQARDLWCRIKHDYPLGIKPRYVSREPGMLDGLNAEGMLIILVGEYWLNPIMESNPIQWVIKQGAVVIKGEIPEQLPDAMIERASEYRGIYDLINDHIQAKQSGPNEKG